MERPREPDRREPGGFPPLPDSLRAAARYMLRVRKAAKAYLGRASQSEAAWNLLLTLQAMEDAQQGYHIGLAAKVADVPHTTALRSLRSLHRDGFVSLRKDPADGRATLVKMTASGEEALKRAFFDAATSPDQSQRVRL